MFQHNFVHNTNIQSLKVWDNTSTLIQRKPDKPKSPETVFFDSSAAIFLKIQNVKAGRCVQCNSARLKKKSKNQTRELSEFIDVRSPTIGKPLTR